VGDEEVGDAEEVDEQPLTNSTEASATAAPSSTALTGEDADMDDLPPLEAAPLISLYAPPAPTPPSSQQSASQAPTQTEAVSIDDARSSSTAIKVEAGEQKENSKNSEDSRVVAVNAGTSASTVSCQVCYAASPPAWYDSLLPAEDAARLLCCHVCGVRVHVACYGVYPLPLSGSYWWCCVCDPSGLQRHEWPGGLAEKANQQPDCPREDARREAESIGPEALQDWLDTVCFEQQYIYDARQMRCLLCRQQGGALLPVVHEFNCQPGRHRANA